MIKNVSEHAQVSIQQMWMLPFGLFLKKARAYVKWRDAETAEKDEDIRRRKEMQKQNEINRKNK